MTLWIDVKNLMKIRWAETVDAPCSSWHSGRS